MTQYNISDILQAPLSIGAFNMASAKLLISLPQDLACRFRATIPSRERSKLLQLLIEAEVKKREALLYQAALAVEADAATHEEALLWDVTLSDGLPS